MATNSPQYDVEGEALEAAYQTENERCDYPVRRSGLSQMGILRNVYFGSYYCTQGIIEQDVFTGLLTIVQCGKRAIM